MKTYKQPPPWPNDPQQWDTRHDIRRFLEDAKEQGWALATTFRELEALNVLSMDQVMDLECLLGDIENIYYGEEEV